MCYNTACQLTAHVPACQIQGNIIPLLSEESFECGLRGDLKTWLWVFHKMHLFLNFISSREFILDSIPKFNYFSTFAHYTLKQTLNIISINIILIMLVVVFCTTTSLGIINFLISGVAFSRRFYTL